MTILLVSHTADLNGAERSLADLAIGLKEVSIDCFVLCPVEGPLTLELRQAGLKTHIMPLPRPQRDFKGLVVFFLLWLPTIFKLLFWLRENKIGVVYNNTIDGLYAPFAAYLARIPCVWHVREVKPANSLLRRLFTWALIRLTAVTVFNSQATMKSYSLHAYPHWQVIYNGVKIDISPPKPTEDKPTIAVLGYAGQFVLNKQPERFLDIVTAVQKSYPTVMGLMAGDGPLLPEIKQLVAQQGLADTIHILGHIRDMADFYKNIDLLILTSDKEAFGRVLVEAMSFGRPVIAANVGGVSEVVLDGETGFLVPADDIHAYTAKIIQLTTNSKLRYQMGLAGYERAINNFSVTQYCQKIIELLQQLQSPQEQR